MMGHQHIRLLIGNMFVLHHRVLLTVLVSIKAQHGSTITGMMAGVDLTELTSNKLVTLVDMIHKD